MPTVVSETLGAEQPPNVGAVVRGLPNAGRGGNDATIGYSLAALILGVDGRTVLALYLYDHGEA